MMRYLSSHVSLALHAERCVGCGLCAMVCPHGVFRMECKRALLVDRDACMECGACALNCPVAAISVTSGVGCAEAIINGLLTGNETCCGEDGCCSGSKTEKQTEQPIEGEIMNEQMKELIAIGASVAAHCQPCLAYHVGKAKELGVDEAGIREAMAVGHMVEKGAMSAMKQFSEEVFEAPAPAAPSCCGGGTSKGKSCCA